MTSHWNLNAALDSPPSWMPKVLASWGAMDFLIFFRKSPLAKRSKCSGLRNTNGFGLQSPVPIDSPIKELYELDQQKLTVVKRIIAYRIKHNLTQGQLAGHVGVTQQHISKIENGEFSSVATLEKVLLAIGYSVRIQAVPLSGKTRNRLNKILSKHS